MREIKFRVPHYRTDTGKFDHFSYWGRGIRGTEFCSPSNTNFTTPRDDEQFTGLKDKNGREIYENDIVHWLVNTNVERVAAIYYDDECACFWMGKDRLDNLVINDWLRGEYTVLGNVHDNPELLK